ncbi:hypothetical protein ABZZ47_33715 [Streptomyces sp. NPDC006465]
MTITFLLSESVSGIWDETAPPDVTSRWWWGAGGEHVPRLTG